MPKNNEREYRSMQLLAREDEATPYTVEGYASTFEPYVLYSFDGVDYSERIEPRAFDTADMSDVIMQFDHEGKVYARSSNGTLKVTVDEKGLKIRADLSSTAAAKELFEEIRTGLITKMSFGFTVEESHYEADTHTRVIDRFRKIYDVSAVSLPANEGTEIGVSTRSWFDGVIEAEKQAERLAAVGLQKRRMLAKIKLLGGNEL